MSFLLRTTTVVALLLAGAAAGPGAAQEEFAPQALAACAIDATTLCAETPRGGGRIFQCLLSHRSELSEQCGAALTPSDYPDPEDGLTITVTIDKIRSKQGVVVVRLTDDPATFPAPRRMVFAPVTGDRVVAIFRRLKPGEYAVTAFHDENGNAILDTADDAREGSGASNGVVGKFDFAASAVKVVSDTDLAVSLSYP